MRSAPGTLLAGTAGFSGSMNDRGMIDTDGPAAEEEGPASGFVLPGPN